ncbi:hypothetical protein DVH05_004845 [Phytophthora capsici]|nr:hypothetical protein DVH05_014800 [Phytophthora capsici]KAG1704818.1 hypothetical protein DVH05_004845 [Phytophthora capsici]
MAAQARSAQKRPLGAADESDSSEGNESSGFLSEWQPSPGSSGPEMLGTSSSANEEAGQQLVIASPPEQTQFKSWKAWDDFGASGSQSGQVAESGNNQSGQSGNQSGDSGNQSGDSVNQSGELVNQSGDSGESGNQTVDMSTQVASNEQLATLQLAQDSDFEIASLVAFEIFCGAESLSLLSKRRSSICATDIYACAFNDNKLVHFSNASYCWMFATISFDGYLYAMHATAKCQNATQVCSSLYMLLCSLNELPAIRILSRTLHLMTLRL